MIMRNDDVGVLVAVGPEGIGDGALGLACAEAVRRELPVTLLHVVHALVTAAPVDPERVEALDNALTKVGHRVLTDAAERARAQVAGRVPVRTELPVGPVGRTIAERSKQAVLTVAERRPAGLERLLTHSVSTSVAAHAHGPALIVPAGWEAIGTEWLPVTVAVDVPLEAAELVEPALDWARRNQRPLVVLHVDWVDEPYEDLLVHCPREERLTWAASELDTGLSKLTDAAAADGVEITRDVHWRRPVDAITHASSRSSVVVLHRRGTDHWGGRLGATTRGVLRHADSPVLVVDRD